MKATINPTLSVHETPIASLTPDPENARRHSERNINAIMQSLMRFGQQKPIVKANGVVIAGCGTLEAAKRLCWDTIAAVEYHGDDEKKKAYALADNRTAELAEWDFEELSKQLTLFEGDVNEMWNPEEINNLKQADWTPRPESPDGPIKLIDKVIFTSEEFEIVTRAMNKMRYHLGDAPYTDGKIISLIADRYLGL